MPLAAGSRIGPYEVAAQIGAGGMGSVSGHRYQAEAAGRDRVLPDALAADLSGSRGFSGRLKSSPRSIIRTSRSCTDSRTRVASGPW